MRLMTTAISALVSLPLLTGCALYRPAYQTPPPDPKTVQEVDKYAEDVKSGYQSFMDTLGVFSFTIGYVVIPLSAATLGVSITGGSTNSITALGLSGLTLFSLGEWTTNKDKIQAFSIGHRTVTCLETASAPLRTIDQLMASFDADFKADQFKEHLDALSRAKEEANKHLSTAIIKTDIKTDAEEALKRAEEVAQNSSASVQALQQTRSKNSENIIIYKQAIQKIDGQTRLAAIKTDQSLSSLKTSLGSMKLALDSWLSSFAASKNATNSASTFAQKKNAVKTKSAELRRADATKAVAVSLEPLEKALDALEVEINYIKQAGVDLQKLLGQLAAVPSVSYEECIVSFTAAFAQATLHVRPTYLDIPQGSSRAIAVAGGKAPYTFKLLDNPATPPPTFGTPSIDDAVTTVMIETKGTPIATYQAVVLDSSPEKQAQLITINVVKQ